MSSTMEAATVFTDDKSDTYTQVDTEFSGNTANTTLDLTASKLDLDHRVGATLAGRRYFRRERAILAERMQGGRAAARSASKSCRRQRNRRLG